MSTARKPGLVRRLSIGAALLGVTAAPFALAIPAEAATTLQGCSVNPLAPVYAGRNAAFVKQVRYNVVIVCAPGRSIEVQQTVMEDDVPPNPDDFIVTRVDSFTSGAGGLVGTRGTTEVLPDTEAGPEEIYQKVRFRVTPAATGVQGPWTTFDPSGTLTITN
jgi:hypothetical protein